MTCIVGLKHNNKVWIGGDSAGVGGYSIDIRADSKVFTNGPYLMGFTSSFRMGQILRWGFAAPNPEEGMDLEKFMVTKFINGVREALKEHGWLGNKEGMDRGGTFLVGVQGRLFNIYDDLQVGESLHGYAAVGCGEDLALGSLHSTKGAPAKRVEQALEAAATHSAGVAAPFIIKSI